MSHERRNKLRSATARVLVRLRHEAGLSQEKLAELAEMERTYLSFLERRLRTPGLETIIRLAGAFGIRAAELVDEIDFEMTNGK